MRAGLLLIVAILAGAVLPAGGAAAREVVAAIGLSLSPYVLAEDRRGMEYDIVKEALALEGHVMTPRFGPRGRMAWAVETGIADAALTQLPGIVVDAHYSDVYVTYRNYAITLAARDLRLNRVEDLASHSVLAFQKASLHLGPAFKAMAEANPAYHEEARQASQPILLFLGRVEVVVADRNIFNWFARQPEVAAMTDGVQAVTYHPIFPPTGYRVAFRDPELRDSFNRGLARLKASGEYDRIAARYSTLIAAEH